MKRHWSMTVLTCCCLTLLMLGCTQQQPDTRVADERAIREADSAWSAATVAKDIDRILSYYAPDASSFPPNAPIVTGLEAIREAWVQDSASPGYVSWKTAKVEVSRASDLGYAFGTYEFTLDDAKGKRVADRGKYLTVWKKQSDGKWKAVADMYSSDLPVTPRPSK
jgi:ketosteroid isomerase-like protein